MAIATGTALLAGSALAAGGAAYSANAAKKGAKAQAKAAGQASDMQYQMFQEGMEATAPYRQAGAAALPGLQQYLSQGGQNQVLSQYRASPLYQQQLEAGNENVLRNASATGALRTGQTDFALGSLPIQMQQQYLDQNFNRLQGIAGLGQGSANMVPGQAQAAGQSMGNYGIAAAQANAQGNQAMANMIGGTMGQLGGLGMYYGARQSGWV